MVHRSYDHLSIGGQPTDKETPGWGAPDAARMDRADDDKRQVAATDAQRRLRGELPFSGTSSALGQAAASRLIEQDEQKKREEQLARLEEFERIIKGE